MRSRASLKELKPCESSKALVVVMALSLLAMLMIVLPASGAPPSLSAKQQQADAILAEINSLDSQLNRAAEAYDGARLQLTSTQRAIKSNTYVLGVARRSFRRAQRNVAQRLRALYMNGDQQSTIEIVLGAKSLDDVITQVDAAESVTRQDEAIAHQTSLLRDQVVARQVALVKDRVRVSRLFAEAASRRSAIESSIQRRQQLLASVKDEIARMQAAEQARQLLIATQVRARLAAQANAAATQNAQPAPQTPTTSADSQPSPPPTTTPTDPSSGATGSATGATTTEPTPPVAPRSRYGGVVGIAMRYLGIPYKWGGASPSTGFDCSGFTMFVYAQIGVSLPHYTGAQWQMGSSVARSDLQPGDLVFFDGLGHEGIYIGNNQFIHAPHTGDVVKISSISGWYADTYVGARRL